MRRAIYAGSFDPITNGHLWMIQNGSKLFDELVVAVGINPNKRTTFSLQERLEMLRKCTKEYSNVKIASFEGDFLVEYAKSINADYILRGIRSNGDYEFERGVMHINSDIRPEILTVFLMPPRELTEISSSLVKGLVGNTGWKELVKKYLPEKTVQTFIDRFRA